MQEALSTQVKAQQSDVRVVFWIQFQRNNDFCRTHQQHLVACLRFAEVVLKETHHVGHLVVVAVLGYNLLFAITREGIFLAMFYLVDYLRIKLLIVNPLVSLCISIYHIVDLYNQVTAAATLVLQWYQRIGGGTESGIALLLHTVHVRLGWDK